MPLKYFTENMKMCNVISEEPSLLKMMSRFGIPLGVGEHTVRQICEDSGVDAATFIAVANFIAHGSNVVENPTDNVSVAALIEYLRRSHTYFLDFQLPEIRRKLLECIDCSDGNEVAYLILKFYDEYMGEVRRHMQLENSKIFTYVGRLLEGRRTPDYEIARFARSHVGIDRKLQELKNIIIKYYTPSCSSERLNNVLYDIFTCESDLHVHCELEDVLFVPAVQELETRVAAESENQDRDNTGSDAGNRENLSEREREIVGCIVRGMTNKEIGERLFISVNTVLTHRKNISRKLNIHSVAGLTIYAIVNHLVNIADIKVQ